MEAQELNVAVPPYGNRVAAKRWGSAQQPTILALHGFGDNAESFSAVAPAFVDAGYSLLAMDLPGHGLSEWTGRYAFAQLGRDILGFVRALGLQEPFRCLAHSYGAECLLYLAGAFPSLFSAIVCVDMVGPPLTREATDGRPRGEWGASSLTRGGDAIKGLCNFLSLSTAPRQPRVFGSVEEAVDVAMEQRSRPHRGGTPMSVSRAGVAALMRRDLSPREGGGWTRRLDPEVAPFVSMQFQMRLPELDALLASRVRSDVLWIRTALGRQLEQSHVSEALQRLEVVDLDAGHHAHLDEGTAPQVASLALEFFRRTAPGARL